MLVLASARSLKLQRADADQLSCTRDQRGAAPVGMRGISEDRLIQHIFPIAGKFLPGCDAAGERACAAAGATDNHAFADVCRFRKPDLERRQIDFSERLHKTEAGLLIQTERMPLYHVTVAEMQPHRFGLGDEIANREHEDSVRSRS